MNGKMNTFMVTYGGSIQQACIVLYRRVIVSDFVHKVAETLTTRLIVNGIGIVTTVIVARVLGPEGRGLYAVAAAIGAIGVQFGNVGLHASNTYYVARDRRLLPALVGNSLLVSFVFGGLGIGLAWTVFALWPHLAPVHGVLLILALVWIPFGLVYMLLQNIILGVQHVLAYNTIELTNKSLGLALIGLVMISKAVMVETVFSTGLIALTLSSIWALWRLQSSLDRFPLPSFTLLRDHIGYGLKAYLSAFFAFLVLRADLLMVQYMLGAEQAGYYSIATTMAEMVYVFPVVVGTILFPKLSALTDTRAKWSLAKKAALGIGVIMVPLVTVTALLAKPVVQLVFGDEFLPAIPAFIWLLPGIVLLSVSTTYMNYFASIGMPFITVYSPGAAGIVNIILNTKLIPILGIVGASISSAAAYGVMLIINLSYVSLSRQND
ncbi:MAG: flippase [Candidatus Latescibacteria bacterium]|nr:flippase [Candidatus Latescibacterota bacterium]